MKLPLFPLPVCLLPEGYSQLRIFEPRYKRLVSEALKSGQGFGMCMLSDDGKSILPIGTVAHIIDFETLSDGLLGISIKGSHRFKINAIDLESDGLKRADVTLLPDWPAAQLGDDDEQLKQLLNKVMAQFPKQLRHYQESDFENAAWTCQRWLEILPLKSSEKQACIASTDHRATLKLLHYVISER